MKSPPLASTTSYGGCHHKYALGNINEVDLMLRGMRPRCGNHHFGDLIVHPFPGQFGTNPFFQFLTKLRF